MCNHLILHTFPRHTTPLLTFACEALGTLDFSHSVLCSSEAGIGSMTLKLTISYFNYCFSYWLSHLGEVSIPKIFFPIFKMKIKNRFILLELEYGKNSHLYKANIKLMSIIKWILMEDVFIQHCKLPDDAWDGHMPSFSCLEHCSLVSPTPSLSTQSLLFLCLSVYRVPLHLYLLIYKTRPVVEHLICYDGMNEDNWEDFSSLEASGHKKLMR